MFPALKESLRHPCLPKQAQGYCSENCVTYHYAYEAVIKNDTEMRDTKRRIFLRLRKG
jgi:hypothetical protein